MIKRALVLFLCLLLACPAWAAQEFTISDIVIQGNQRVKKDDILEAISVRPGQTVTPQDIDQAIQDIYRMGRFVDIAAGIEDWAGVDVLVFDLVERPLVRNIRFEGNDEFDDAKLRELITVRVPDIYDPAEVTRSVETIKAAYDQEGYYAAIVTADSHVNEENESLVTFRIKEGDLVRIKAIYFEGNTVFNEKELRDAMETREKWFLSWLTDRGNYNNLMITQDLERIADLYYNEGYVRVKVREPVISLVDENRNMLLLINIEEGDQYFVEKINAQGDLIDRKGEILNLVDLEPGDVFARDKLRDGVLTVTDMYADQGYAYVNVAPLTRVNDADKSIDIMLDVEQGPQVSVERINITGNAKTRDKVIRREMKLTEGELFSASDLKRSKARINNLGFFEAVDITTSEGSEPALIDVDVNVKERSTGTFSVGAGFSSVEGFVGQGSVTQENFLGRGWKLNLAGSIGGESSTYQVGLTDPYFLDTRWVLGFELYRTDREWTDFSRKATGGAVKGGHPLGEYSRFLTVYRYEQKEIYDVGEFASQDIKDEEGTSTISSVTTTLSRSTVNNRLDPSEGGQSDLSWEIAGLGGTEKFSKYIFDHRHFWPWRWGTVFSIHGQIGYVHGYDGKEIPLDERFFLGGINTLRGFENREVGPRDPLTGDYTGGDKEAYFNFEFVFPLVKDIGLKGVTFFDVGNAWGEDEDFFDKWRYSVGAGIRWMSPMGPLRLEWGYNLDPYDWEDNSKFEFMIGRFF
ncbi:MAG: outer membrane protein assembly factor BamA [Deltaproteobacteria bacterium]|jgi:outer membrane protein insertion porin family|nr:outer membrane protein assembly factor BamA [Deltaproteobacteria bacterium]